MSTSLSDGRSSSAVGTEGTPAKRRRGRRRHRMQLFEPIPRKTYAAIAVISFVALMAVWSYVSYNELVQNLFLPTPTQVWQAIVNWAQDGTLWTDIKDSVTRIVLGFAVSTIFAVPIGVFMGTFKHVEAAVEPSVDFIRYMPAVAFIPLTLIWFGTSEGEVSVRAKACW